MNNVTLTFLVVPSRQHHIDSSYSNVTGREHAGTGRQKVVHLKVLQFSKIWKLQLMEFSHQPFDSNVKFNVFLKQIRTESVGWIENLKNIDFSHWGNCKNHSLLIFFWVNFLYINVSEFIILFAYGSKYSRLQFYRPFLYSMRLN